MKKMKCWKWNFLSQRWKTIKGAPGLRMIRRALSRRVNSELGRVWPDLAWHAARWTPIFRSIWGGILNISQNLTIQSNLSQCEIYTLRYCASAGFKGNQIEISLFEKFNDYSRSWGEIFDSCMRKMMFFKRSQSRSRSILGVILGCLGSIFEDSELKMVRSTLC